MSHVPSYTQLIFPETPGERVLMQSTTLRKPTKQTNKPVFEMTPVYEAILKAVASYQFITGEQIIRHLGQSENSLPKLREKLLILSGMDKEVSCPAYLHRFFKARHTPTGSLPYVYTLATAGIKYLQALGMDVDRYFRPYKNKTRTPNDIDHTLAINELLLTAKHLGDEELTVEQASIYCSVSLETIKNLITNGKLPAQKAGRTYLIKKDALHQAMGRFIAPVSLYASQHDFVLKHSPVKLVLKRVQDNGVSEPLACKLIPDGFLDFRYEAFGKKKQACILIEMDMDTTEKFEFKKKIAMYLEFIHSGRYTDMFHTTSVTVVFVTPKGDKRASEMRAWTEQALQKPLYHPQSYSFGADQQPGSVDADLFRFAAIPEGALSPKQVFLDPLWYTPFDNSPKPLLDRLPQRRL